MSRSLKAPAAGEVILPGAPKPELPADEIVEDPISVSHSQLMEIYPAIEDGEDVADDEVTAVEQISEILAAALDDADTSDPSVQIGDDGVTVRWSTVSALERDWAELSEGRVPAMVFTEEGPQRVHLVLPDGHAYAVEGRVLYISGTPCLRVRLGVKLRQRIRAAVR